MEASRGFMILLKNMILKTSTTWMKVQFYIMQPDRPISNGPVKGCKKARDKITLAFCANADGSNKITVTMIGKSETLDVLRISTHQFMSIIDIMQRPR
jgi:hypothetical protein